MRVAVCLLTCDRHDYTKVTLESFSRHNELGRFTLLHGDDASSDERISPLARSFGFRTMVRNIIRRGVVATTRDLIAMARARGADWVLLLQNDFETVKPFPWELFHRVAADPGVWCLRLYGEHKNRDGSRPAGTRHKGRGGAPIDWQSYGDGAQVAVAHFSALPSVCKSKLAFDLLTLATTMRGAMVASGGIDLNTVRVTENVVWHIGDERTPDFMP